MNQVINLFRNFNIFLETDNTGKHLLVPPEYYKHWFESTAEWLQDTFDLEELRQSSLFAGREVILSGINLLDAYDDFKEIAKVFSDNNMAVTMQIEAIELYNHLEKVLDLAKNHIITAVCISIHKESTDISSPELMWEKLTETAVSLIITGAVNNLKTLSVFSSPSLNSQDIRICPYPEEGETYETLPENTACNCVEHLIISIGADGFIYPCLGLINIEKCAIGNITDDKAFYDSFIPFASKMIEQGPDISSSGPVANNSELAWFCRRHRYEVSHNE
ncbi:MAG: hypothetical protein K6G26_03895 [Lachnospiraceae bacterium]|nr:hypothetical protein [Lachnospiraceae bacterium]